MTHFCRDCDQVHPDTRKKEEPWRWRCMAMPVQPGYGLVDPDYSPDPPYARCSDVRRELERNGTAEPGECPMFVPVRELETVDG